MAFYLLAFFYSSFNIFEAERNIFVFYLIKRYIFIPILYLSNLNWHRTNIYFLLIRLHSDFIFIHANQLAFSQRSTLNFIDSLKEEAAVQNG